MLILTKRLLKCFSTSASKGHEFMTQKMLTPEMDPVTHGAFVDNEDQEEEPAEDDAGS